MLWGIIGLIFIFFIGTFSIILGLRGIKGMVSSRSFNVYLYRDMNNRAVTRILGISTLIMGIGVIVFGIGLILAFLTDNLNFIIIGSFINVPAILVHYGIVFYVHHKYR